MSCSSTTSPFLHPAWVANRMRSRKTLKVSVLCVMLPCVGACGRTGFVPETDEQAVSSTRANAAGGYSTSGGSRSTPSPGEDSSSESNPDVGSAVDPEAPTTCESELELCEGRAGECGELRVEDSCGTTRVVYCGSCGLPNTCRLNTCTETTQWSEISGLGSSGVTNLLLTANAGRAGAIDTEGRILIAHYGETAEGHRLFVHRWNGVDWDELGGASAAGIPTLLGGPANHPSMAVTSDDRIVLLWREAPSTVALLIWDGSSWTPLGTSDTGNGLNTQGTAAMGPRLTTSSDGSLYVSYIANVEGRNRLYLRRWQSGQWTELGGSDSELGLLEPNGDVRNHGIDVRSVNGEIVVAAAVEFNDTPPAKIQLKRWDGSAWAGVGGSDQGDGLTPAGLGASSHPQTRLTADGRIYVTWRQRIGEDDFPYLKLWNGSQWEELAGSAVGKGLATSDTQDTNTPALALDTLDRPVVAWPVYNGINAGLHVRYFAEGSWREFSGSATGAGISSATHIPYNLTLMRGPEDQLAVSYVSWLDPNFGVFAVVLE